MHNVSHFCSVLNAKYKTKRAFSHFFTIFCSFLILTLNSQQKWKFDRRANEIKQKPTTRWGREEEERQKKKKLKLKNFDNCAKVFPSKNERENKRRKNKTETKTEEQELQKHTKWVSGKETADGPGGGGRGSGHSSPSPRRQSPKKGNKFKSAKTFFLPSRRH